MTLEEQDRSKWDQNQIQAGLVLVPKALKMRVPGPYQLQAAIAAIHAEAATPDETDWRQIAALYQELARRDPSPVIRLNQAVAIAMTDGLERGLELVEVLHTSGELTNYHLLHAARADLLRRLGRFAEAAASYDKALALATNAD